VEDFHKRIFSAFAGFEEKKVFNDLKVKRNSVKSCRCKQRFQKKNAPEKSPFSGAGILFL